MSEAAALQRQLLLAQNRDGGWSYGRGSSWTEPTAFALLALRAHQVRDRSVNLGLEWLRRTQRADGGWAPQPGVDTSTWVTSVASLALSDCESAAANYRRGIHWLAGQVQPPGTAAGRFAL